MATLLLLCENNVGFLMAPVETDTDKKKKKKAEYLLCLTNQGILGYFMGVLMHDFLSLLGSTSWS